MRFKFISSTQYYTQCYTKCLHDLLHTKANANVFAYGCDLWDIHILYPKGLVK